jgi:MOSC domain-containing protein YiiM
LIIQFFSGDLGENILIDGINFRFFRVGERYKFTSVRKKENIPSNDDTLADEAIIEITEPMEPCANLCKLPYINDPSLSSSKDRVSRCRSFIDALGQRDGLRGWYAKVIAGGIVSVGNSISLVAVS